MPAPVDSEQATAVGLLEHLALVNEHEDLVGDEAGLIAWAQETLSRAYALRVSLRYHCFLCGGTSLSPSLEMR